MINRAPLTPYLRSRHGCYIVNNLLPFYQLGYHWIMHKIPLLGLIVFLFSMIGLTESE